MKRAALLFVFAACVMPSSNGGVGGGSGVSGGGPSAGGGTVGQVDHELVSGTRLRSMVYAGPDGSKMSAGFFWDNQLNVYCGPTQPFGGALVVGPAEWEDRCLPLTLAGSSASTSNRVFSDSSCTVRLAETGATSYYGYYFGGRLSRAGLPAFTTTHLLEGELDGGFTLYPAVPFNGSGIFKVAELGDGGCTPVNASVFPEYQGRLYQRSGTAVPASTFALLPLTRE